MGTLAAGIKEIFATAKTTGSNVMLCGNDGTPDGHMTMANLANVLGVPILPQNTCKATIIHQSSYYTQKVECTSNRGSGIILFNNNSGGEGIIEFTYLGGQNVKVRAKLIIYRGDSDLYIPSLYFDGNNTFAIVAKEVWGSWTFISSSTVPPKGTVDSDLTGFTQVAILKTPALDYDSLEDLALALGASGWYENATYGSVAYLKIGKCNDLNNNKGDYVDLYIGWNTTRVQDIYKLVFFHNGCAVYHLGGIGVTREFFRDTTDGAIYVKISGYQTTHFKIERALGYTTYYNQRIPEAEIDTSTLAPITIE